MSVLSTDELLKQLKASRSAHQLKDYLDSLPNETAYQSFSEFLTAFIGTRNISESQLIYDSQLHRTYAYQILNGTKNPSRNKVLALCIAAGMDYENTQRALTLAGHGKLYPRRKEDSVIIFALEQKLNVLQTNELLYEECGETL